MAPLLILSFLSVASYVCTPALSAEYRLSVPRKDLNLVLIKGVKLGDNRAFIYDKEVKQPKYDITPAEKAQMSVIDGALYCPRRDDDAPVPGEALYVVLGATLVSDRVILTNAHAFIDEHFGKARQLEGCIFRNFEATPQSSALDVSDDDENEFGAAVNSPGMVPWSERFIHSFVLRSGRFVLGTLDPASNRSHDWALAKLKSPIQLRGYYPFPVAKSPDDMCIGRSMLVVSAYQHEMPTEDLQDKADKLEELIVQQCTAAIDATGLSGNVHDYYGYCSVADGGSASIARCRDKDGKLHDTMMMVGSDKNANYQPYNVAPGSPTATLSFSHGIMIDGALADEIRYFANGVWVGRP
jgi:hypothetical protein